MKLGYIGLGKMGLNMSRRLVSKNYEVVAFDPNEKTRKEATSFNIKTVSCIKNIISSVGDGPRQIWIMVPYQVVDKVLEEITPLLSKGDTIIDGGNSPYKESVRRHKELKDKGLRFIDVGVSGGPEGALNGASLMVGGERKDFSEYEDLFRDLSVLKGYGYMGKPGAGHFVKMVHNGIEYGMMQSIGEGFEIMKKSPFDLNLTKVSEVYDKGTVIESKLVTWLHQAYIEEGENLDSISGEVSHSGEGLWTIEAAKELSVPAEIIEKSLKFRIDSKNNPSYTGKVVSALRNQFGGHEVKK